jgi:hypothetical protein
MEPNLLNAMYPMQKHVYSFVMPGPPSIIHRYMQALLVEALPNHRDARALAWVTYLLQYVSTC